MSDIIGQMLMAMDPKIRPWDQVVKEGAQADTALIELANLRRQQEAQKLARQYYQQHPEALMGQGGGQQIPTLATLGQPVTGAPMTQQTMLPGQAPGAAHVVPGGQDLSRFATGQPQSTIASLSQPQGPSQAPPQQLMDLMRRNPDAAFAVMQQQQQQQDLALKRDEQRLTMGTKVAEYVGRVAQGVTSPETLEQARQELARIHPQAAAQLPQTYSKEAMVPFVKTAVGVKDNALLQLETWKNQIEEKKLGVQLAQAGYQGLGDDVTGIIRGLSEEQVKQFGGRTTPAAIAYATEEARKLKAPPGQTAEVTTELRKMGKDPFKAAPEDLTQAGKNIQERELARAGEAERLKFQLEQEQQKTLPLQDARKEDQDRFVYKGTGEVVPGVVPYGQVKTLQGEKDPTKAVVHLTTDDKKQLTNLKQLEPVLDQYRELIQYAYGPGGPMANYTRSPGGTISAAWAQATQADPKLQALRRSLTGQLQSLVRGLGARGDLNEQELKAATEMIANFDASGSLGLSLGPMVGTGGVGVGASIKPSFSIPDTPAVGVELANQLIGTVNKRVGTILQHEGYARTPGITLQRVQTGGVPPRTWDVAQPATPGQPQPPTGGAVAPPATTAAPVPAQPPAAGPPIFPRTPIREPGAPAPAPGTQSQAVPAPAPATRPAPPTARSTPAQDEAYQQWIRQQPAFTAPAPAPANARTPATKSTPGRQSQAPAGTRLAGAPKYMNLADVAEAVRQTGKSRTEVERRARELGYVVYGSKLKLPEVTMVG